MSVIAYDGLTVAADSLAVADGYKSQAPTQKLKRGAGGKIYGIIGYLGWFEAWIRWYEDGAVPANAPTHKTDANPGGFIVFDLDCCRCFTAAFAYPDEETPPYAYGSGSSYAIGAMRAGASAAEAVEIACEVDDGCGGPIQIMELR